MSHAHGHPHGHGHGHSHGPDHAPDLSHFKDEAENWDDKPELRELRERIFNTILERGMLKANARILDFGCGSGALTASMAAHVTSAVGLDATPEMINVALRKCKDVPNLKFFCMEIDNESQLGEIGAPFDLVVSVLVFHHLPDIPKILNLLAHGLAPDGQILIVEIEKTDHSDHFHTEDKHASVVSHGFSAKTFEAEFARAGLDRIAIDSPLDLEKDDGTGHIHKHPLMFATAFKPAV